tara:strand:- start:123 stop:602 length:480 start_codon:yes stop_codon:yes gene_type:complete
MQDIEKALERVIDEKKWKYFAILPAPLAKVVLVEWNISSEDEGSDKELRLAMTESFVAFLMGDCETCLKPFYSFIARLNKGCKMDFLELLPVAVRERARAEWGDWRDPSDSDLPSLPEDSQQFNVLLYEAFSLWLFGMDIESCLELPGFKKFLSPKGGD